MTRHVLDVNVVIALVDPLHVHHERAHRWFAGRDDAWHTSPTVQNGALRILGHPRYPNSQPLPVVIKSVSSLVSHHGHEFLPDGVSLLTGDVRTDRMLASSQVTDAYLLALAASAGALLATFDTKLVTAAVPGGGAALFPVP
ncbi:MAG: PIN domain-containing protein [Microbacterium sp.]